MNPGYFSYIAMTLSAILVCFGWRTQAVGNSSTGGVLLFSGSWLVGAGIVWGGGGTVAGTFVYVPLAVLTTLMLRRSLQPKEIGSALTFALLLGAMFSLVELVEAVDPLMIVLHPIVDPALLITILIVGYTRRPPLQFALVSVSLIVNDAYTTLLYSEWKPLYFGGRSFQDSWWLTAMAVRIASEAVRMGNEWLPRFVSRLLMLLRLRR